MRPAFWFIDGCIFSVSSHRGRGKGYPKGLFYKDPDPNQIAALNIPANLETQQWPQDWKRSVFFPIPKEGNVKECSSYHTIAFISHTNKAMLKILQARLQAHVNQELSDVQAGFRKGRGARDQIVNIHWIIGTVRVPEKDLLLLY